MLYVECGLNVKGDPNSPRGLWLVWMSRMLTDLTVCRCRLNVHVDKDGTVKKVTHG